VTEAALPLVLGRAGSARELAEASAGSTAGGGSDAERTADQSTEDAE
jgi:hypothetical protein